MGDDPRVTVISDKSVQLARTSTDIVELEFDCVLETKELTPATVRCLAAACFLRGAHWWLCFRFMITHCDL